MSGTSRNSMHECPNCENDSLTAWTDHKPFEMLEVECHNCGFSTCTKVYYKNLNELNEYRDVFEEEPLTILPKQTFEKE